MNTKEQTKQTASAPETRTLDHRTLEGANTNSAPKGVKDKTYKYFGVSKAEYDAAQRTLPAEKPTFNEALQQAKEAIGFFANGDQSHVANEAKHLWYAIDDVQQGKQHVNHADKLAEALRDTLAMYKACRPKNLRIVALVDNAETALAAYESEVQS